MHVVDWNALDNVNARDSTDTPLTQCVASDRNQQKYYMIHVQCHVLSVHCMSEVCMCIYIVHMCLLSIELYRIQSHGFSWKVKHS